MPYLYRPNAGRPIIPDGYTANNEFGFGGFRHVIMDTEKDYAESAAAPNRRTNSP